MMQTSFSASSMHTAQAELARAQQQQAIASQLGAIDYMRGTSMQNMTVNGLAGAAGFDAGQTSRLSQNFQAAFNELEQNKQNTGYSTDLNRKLALTHALAMTAGGQLGLRLGLAGKPGSGGSVFDANLGLGFKATRQRSTESSATANYTEGQERSNTAGVSTSTGRGHEQAIIDQLNANLQRSRQATIQDGANAGLSTRHTHQWQNQTNRSVAEQEKVIKALSFAEQSGGTVSQHSSDVSGQLVNRNAMVAIASEAKDPLISQAVFGNTTNDAGQIAFDRRFAELYQAGSKGCIHSANQFMNLTGIARGAVLQHMGARGPEIADRLDQSQGKMLTNFLANTGVSFNAASSMLHDIKAQTGPLGVPQYMTGNPGDTGAFTNTPGAALAEQIQRARSMEQQGYTPPTLPSPSTVMPVLTTQDRKDMADTLHALKNLQFDNETLSKLVTFDKDGKPILKREDFDAKLLNHMSPDVARLFQQQNNPFMDQRFRDAARALNQSTVNRIGK